jgi:hypothetical protein
MRTIPNKRDPSFSGIRENMGKLLAKSLLTSATTSYFLNIGHSLAKIGRWSQQLHAARREYRPESISASGDMPQITTEQRRSHGCAVETGRNPSQSPSAPLPWPSACSSLSFESQMNLVLFSEMDFAPLPRSNQKSFLTTDTFLTLRTYHHPVFTIPGFAIEIECYHKRKEFDLRRNIYRRTATLVLISRPLRPRCRGLWRRSPSALAAVAGRSDPRCDGRPLDVARWK